MVAHSKAAARAIKFENVDVPLCEWLAAATDDPQAVDPRGLTIKGRLADAVVKGIKRYENRPKRLGRRYLFVHKGKSATPERWRGVINRNTERMGDSLPAGTIVGVMRIDEYLEAKDVGEADVAWVAGPVVHKVGAFIELESPVPHEGQLGEWRVSREALAAIRAQQNAALPPTLVRAAQLGLRGRK